MQNLSRRFPWAGVLALVFLMSVTLQASDKKSITLFEQSMISDTKLSPGGYKVEIVSNGDTGELHFYKGKTVVATAPFETEKLERKADRSSLRYQVDPGNLRRIIELRIAGEDRVYKIVDKDKQAKIEKSSSGS